VWPSWAATYTTQEALAHAAGVTVGHLSMVERGHSNPTWATVKSIAAALDTSMADLAKLAAYFEQTLFGERL
jgi:transcriptional regulator with XRE-family HTH domain